MFRVVAVLAIVIALLLGAFSFLPQASASEPLAAISVAVSEEDSQSLGNGRYTTVCKYRIFVNGTRRATVKIRQKARWVDGYGVKMLWAYESFRHDYWPNDGYDIGGPYNANWGSFPTGWDSSQATYAEYSYVGWWVFGSALWADSPGEFNCVAIEI